MKQRFSNIINKYRLYLESYNTKISPEGFKMYELLVAQSKNDHIKLTYSYDLCDVYRSKNILNIFENSLITHFNLKSNANKQIPENN